MIYITIDTGTTNTRIRLMKNNEILTEYRDKTGVRDTAITGSLDKLKLSIKKGIENCLNSSHMRLDEIDKIIASGMITSNLGLIEIPHLVAPVGLKDIHKNIVVKTFKEIIDKPIYFIPGVKNRVQGISSEAFEMIDMMRGEETESLGALHLNGSKGEIIYISPGSHTKFVFFDNSQRIVKCSTTITGELLWALSKETILASSIPHSLLSSTDKDYIKRGIEAVKKYGFSKTCFLVRIMDTFTGATPNQRVNFIAGAISYYDIKSIENELRENKFKILIGGKKILRDLYYSIFEIIDYDISKVIILDEELVEKSSPIGAINILKGN